MNRTIFSLLFVSSLAMAETKPAGCVLGVSSVAKEEKVECDGSAGQLCGLVKNVSFVLVVKGGARSVGFRDEATGLTTEFQFQRSNGAYSFYAGSLRVETSNFGRRLSEHIGAFFAETTAGTLRLGAADSSAFRIGPTTDADLRAFAPNLGCFVNGTN